MSFLYLKIYEDGRDSQKTEFPFPDGGELCTAAVTCGQGTMASLSSL